jgi:glycosyltransferase involved in cell wall biosynthesis
VKIAFLVPDNRENFRRYELTDPYFGTAPAALLEGFASLANQADAPEIHVISCAQKRIPAPKKLASNIWFHSLHVPKAGWLRSGYLGCAFAVRKKLREIHPDLVHAQGTERDCAISAILSPYPKILTIHGNLRLIKKQVGFRPFSAMWLQSYLEGFSVPRFDGVICITNYTREAVEHEVPKTWVVPNAVDPSFLELGQQRLSDSCSRPSTLDSRPQCPIILVVANVDPRKNQNAFIKALDPLAQSMSFEVRFFGSCPDVEYGREFHRLVSERPWCHYGGMIGRGELKQEMGGASLLMLPTLEDNCPMVVLEAMAAGIPVIASKVGGIPDLIEDGISGLLCTPARPKEFAAALTRILDDTRYRKEMAGRAAHEAKVKFHPLLIAKKHMQIYSEIAGYVSPAKVDAC